MDGEYPSSCPGLPLCRTYGVTPEGVCESQVRRGAVLDLPSPTTRSGDLLRRVPSTRNSP